MSDTATIDPPVPPPAPIVVPTVLQIFLAFLKMGVLGFGGVLPWSRRVLVEERGWLTPQEYSDTFALCQFLPGGNIMNMAVVIGQQFRGMRGTIAAIVGVLAAPAAIVVALGSVYLRYGQTETGEEVLAGVTAAAVGFLVAMALKLSEPLFAPGVWVPRAVAVAVFVAIGLFRLPLPLVLAVMAPLSIAWAWRKAT